MSMSSSVFTPLMVIFNAVPCKPSLSARRTDTQKILQAVSLKTSDVVLAQEELVKFSFVT